MVQYDTLARRAKSIEQRALSRLHFRVALAGQNLRNSALVDTQKSGNLMIIQALNEFQMSNSVSHFRRNGRRSATLHIYPPHF